MRFWFEEDEQRAALAREAREGETLPDALQRLARLHWSESRGADGAYPVRIVVAFENGDVSTYEVEYRDGRWSV